MAYSNGIVTAPVGIGDVQKAVGGSSTDLGSLIANASINIWSKYKPVRFASPNTVGQLNGQAWKADSQFSGASDNPAWWWGDYDFGVSFNSAQQPVSNTQTGMTQALEYLRLSVNGGNNGWTYKRPRGSSGFQPNTNTNADTTTKRNEWYRLADFHQYNHTTTPPIKSASISPSAVTASSTGNWSVGLNAIMAVDNGIDNRSYLFPWDVLSLWTNKKTANVSFPIYLGIAIFKVSGSTYTALGWVTGGISEDTGLTFNGVGVANADSTGADRVYSDTEVVLTLKSGATYAIMPFFCSEQLPQPSRGRSKQPGKVCQIWTCPLTSIYTFKAQQAATTSKIGLPTVSTKKIPITDKYSATVMLDATDTSYYNGGTASIVTVMVVNASYTDGAPITASNSAYYQEFTNVSVTSGSKTKITDLVDVSCPSTTTWRVIIDVLGEKTTYNLMGTVLTQ